MLIFDQFRNLRSAKLFAHDMGLLGRQAQVFESQEESNKVDPFPFQLVPPIVLVQRCDPATEERIERDAKAIYGGTFAGT
jgi:hypothetical protein